MTARRRLPPRRGAVALDIEHAGHRYRMHVGYFPDGGVGEVFLDATKQNSTLDAFAACRHSALAVAPIRRPAGRDRARAATLSQWRARKPDWRGR